MRARVVLLVLALGVPVAFAAAAHAGPCVTVTRVPGGGGAIVCVLENDCLLYEHSGSSLHEQTVVCLP